jgi:polysaccharide pyruvyl transferase WcaK-like protein
MLASLEEAERNRIHLLSSEYGACELKGIIGKCEFFIGSRMHACIAAISQGVPTVAVAYSRKFTGVFDSVGAAEMVLDAWSVSEDDALEMIMQRFLDRDASKDRLEAGIQLAQDAVARTFKDLMI